MDSNADLLTGEYLQDYQAATYESDGESWSIDLQYSSLQAHPEPTVTGAWQVNTDVGSGTFGSTKMSLSVGGSSQGSPITMNIPSNGTYLIQLQAVGAASMTTGMYSLGLSSAKNLNSGGTSTDSYNSSLMVVNNDASPVGSGWSIGGFQQITVGSAGSTLMISDGTDAPEEFTSSNGTNYTGDPTDTSTLTYSSSSHTYTRAYQDGTTITFNSSGQETSFADPYGNTTSYAYVTSGAAAGALHTITDPVGLVTTLSYNAGGHLSTITDPANRVTTFTIDSSGDLTEVVNPDGGTTQYGYNASHEMTSETDPNSFTATIGYDTFGRLNSETLFDGTFNREDLTRPGIGPPELGEQRFDASRHDDLPQYRDGPQRLGHHGHLRQPGRRHIRDRWQRRHHDDHPQRQRLADRRHRPDEPDDDLFVQLQRRHHPDHPARREQRVPHL